MFTMSDNKELTATEKFIALAVVAVIALVAVIVLGLVTRSSNGGDGDAAGSYSCDTRFDATACPEPSYDQTIEESKAYPDATPYDY